VHCDELEVVQLLLAADSDITAQAEFPDLDWGTVNAGDTVMHIAAAKGSIDCIQILLRAYVSAPFWATGCSSMNEEYNSQLLMWILHVTCHVACLV
jgi:ankyrin repeat protein